MPFQLTLTLDYRSDTEWRWVLADADRRFVADHEVALDSADPVYPGFVDLPQRLKFLRGIRPEKEILAELGEWMGKKVFGAVGEKLLKHECAPACVVQVRVPKAAQNLLFRPFELAHVGGKPLAERGFRFIYTVADAEAAQTAGHKEPEGHELRILGVFSLPDGATPLNLREERHRLQKLVQGFEQKGNRAVHLRLLQYGATRELLKETLEEAPGWDVLHFSGHGLQGELVLEKPDGSADRVPAEVLAKLLAPTKSRLKLLTLSACYSGAADVRAARALVGLDVPPTRAPDAAPVPTSAILPSLGQRLAEELDCAVLAMRYPVQDDFATELALELYRRLLEKKQPLPESLQLALGSALESDAEGSGISRITPLLFGARAAALKLSAPQRPRAPVQPKTGLLGFPAPPERFVGRLKAMMHAGQTLAPQSDKTGVVFYGMAGAGKTACALELAHRYDSQHVERFTGFAWYKAPDEGHDISGALVAFAIALERQLDGLALVGLVDNPETLKHKVVPYLRGVMQDNAILIVLDNVESLLTPRGEWRDARWGELLSALLEHNGLGRVVLTSRRLPLSLAGSKQIQSEAIHALSFPESVLLARQMPHLRPLFADEGGRDKLRRVLGAVQGHPKLMELANALASDAVKLEAQLARAESGAEGGDVATSAFFTGGVSSRDEDDFVRVLHGWTDGVATGLDTTARLLALCLAQMEEADRTGWVVKTTWQNLLKRLTGERGKPAVTAPEPALGWARAALAEEGLGLEAAVSRLAQAGLVDVETSGSSATEQHYRLHPGVAEALRAAAPAALPDVVDRELGDYFTGMLAYGLKTEIQGGGPLVVAGARSAAPYLLRQQRWDEANTALERLLQRDNQSATVAFAIPLLRQVVDHTCGTERALLGVGVLARTLSQAGCHAEAEQMYRDIIARCVAQENFRLASTAAGDLLNLLRLQGGLEEALQLVEQKVEYTRRAGLGRWTQLSDETMRLQVLVDLGHYDEVLAEVERHRPTLKSLPEESDAPETASPWNVREVLLDAGRAAALYSAKWEIGLALTGEIADFERKRGADAVELARTRFHDHGPLIRLKRFAEARAMLEDCRSIFEQAKEIIELGRVYGALADLEASEGGLDTAVRFETFSLRYKYQAGTPEDCAISHHNLANYLRCSSGAPEAVLAHWLAAGVILVQIDSGRLPTNVNNLANLTLPPAPPAFEQVVALVEQGPGIRFKDLFARLPKRFPSGDAALQALWDMALAEQHRRKGPT